MKIETNDTYSLSGGAKLLGVSASTMKSAVLHGKLHATLLADGTKVYTRDSLMAWDATRPKKRGRQSHETWTVGGVLFKWNPSDPLSLTTEVIEGDKRPAASSVLRWIKERTGVNAVLDEEKKGKRVWLLDERPSSIKSD